MLIVNTFTHAVCKLSIPFLKVGYASICFAFMSIFFHNKYSDSIVIITMEMFYQNQLKKLWNTKFNEMLTPQCST